MADEKRRRGHHEGTTFVRKRKRKDGSEITRYGFAATIAEYQMKETDMDLIGIGWLYLGVMFVVLTSCATAVAVKKTWEIVRR